MAAEQVYDSVDTSVLQPVVVHLALWEAERPLREAIGMTPLDLGPDLDIVLGWDCISSRDLRFLYPQGRVTGVGPQGPLVPLFGPPPPQQCTPLC